MLCALKFQRRKGLELLESLIQLSLGGLGLLTAIEGLSIWKKTIVGTDNLDCEKKILVNLSKYKKKIKSLRTNPHYMIHYGDINEEIIQILREDSKEKWIEIDKFKDNIETDLILASFVWKDDFEEIIFQKNHIFKKFEKGRNSRSKSLLSKQFDRYQKYNKDCQLTNKKDESLVEYNILFSNQEDGYNNKLEELRGLYIKK
jgi:hypothetical protein